ncbi:MAG: hypothetical protein KJ002_01860 [Candidatus Dadabacteria bacterium]|nr:hypothetical protein [Candidatus Dadabacteria bacterium]
MRVLVGIGYKDAGVWEISKGGIDDGDGLLVLKPSKEWESLNLPLACKAWLKRHL